MNNWFRFFVVGLGLNKRLVLAFAIALVCLITDGGFAFASPSSSWSSKPDWFKASNSYSNKGNGQNNTRPYDPSARAAAPFSPGSNNLALDIGQVFLMGDLGKTYTDSLGFKVHYTYGVSDLFGFDSTLGYSSHSDFSLTNDLSLTSVNAGLRVNLAWFDKIVPYAAVGMGFYRVGYTSLELGTSISPVLFGLYIGPGVSLVLTDSFFFGAGLTFNDIFENTRTRQDGTVMPVGGSFSTFSLNAGFSM